MNRSTPRESASQFLILEDSVEHEYPEALVRGMIDITDGVCRGLFGEIALHCEPPSVVRDRIMEQVRKVIVGQDEVLDQILIALFVGGHCLITGLPGTAPPGPAMKLSISPLFLSNRRML